MRKRKQKQIVVVVVATLVVYLFFRFLFFSIFPFLCALAVGKFLSPFIHFLEEKCHFPRGFSVVAPVVTFFCVCSVALYYLVGMFCGQLVSVAQYIPYYQEIAESKMNQICGWCDGILFMEEGTVFRFFSLQVEQFMDQMNLGGVSKITLSAFRLLKKILGWVGTFGVIIIVTCMAVKDMDELKQSYRNCLFYEDLQKLFRPLTKVGFAYVKAQLIIISLVSVVCVAGFWLSGSPYALLFGVIIGILDAFPILGSGLFLVPITVFSFLDGSYKSGILFLIIYGLCQVIRQFLEPKLIGDKIGIQPIYILLSVYLGMKCYGIAGVVLGPASLVLIQSCVDLLMEEEH